MAELALTRDQRLALKASAHHLNPVVLMGSGGLTPPVLAEIERALVAHELIKVRAPGDDRDERAALFAAIADALGAARVQSIGKLCVLYRPRPEEPAAEPPPRAATRSPKAPARGPVPARGRAPTPVGAKADERDIRRTQRPVAPRQPGGAGKRAAKRT